MEGWREEERDGRREWGGRKTFEVSSTEDAHEGIEGARGEQQPQRLSRPG